MLLSGADTWVQFITTLIIFIFVLALIYFVTKWIAGYQKGVMGQHNIQVIDTIRITQNQCIQIVKIGNKYLAIGISKDNMTVLTELEEDEIQVFSEEKKSLSFQEILEQMKSKKH